MKSHCSKTGSMGLPHVQCEIIELKIFCVGMLLRKYPAALVLALVLVPVLALVLYRALFEICLSLKMFIA